MKNHLLKLAATKAARMLGLVALVMSLGALSLTSCDDHVGSVDVKPFLNGIAPPDLPNVDP